MLSGWRQIWAGAQREVATRREDRRETDGGTKNRETDKTRKEGEKRAVKRQYERSERKVNL